MDISDIATNNKIQGADTSSPNAFIIYRPGTKRTKTFAFYNEEACCILSLSDIFPKKGKVSSPDISALCSKWKGLLDKKNDEQKVNNKGGDYIDIFQSHRRQYAVRAIVLAGDSPHLQKHEKQYLFTLERICRDNENHSRIFRQWNLNSREREIVQLLLADRSNKEIARALGLSLNTVKGYLKLLTSKLGVGTRTGIVSTLLTGKSRHIS